MNPVWIIDDDRSIRWVLEKALGREDIPAKSYGSADDALAALDAGQRPQVLVSDIRMPGKSCPAKFVDRLWLDFALRRCLARTERSAKCRDNGEEPSDAAVRQRAGSMRLFRSSAPVHCRLLHEVPTQSGSADSCCC